LLPVAYAVAFDSAVANAIASIGVPWLPVVVKVSAVVGVPDVVLIAVDVSGVPAVARVSSVAAVTSALNVPSATGVYFQRFCHTCCCWHSFHCWRPYCGLWLASLSLKAFLSVPVSLLFGVP